MTYPLPTTTLLAGAVDLRALPGIRFISVDGLFSDGEQRGSDLVIPGVAGDYSVGELPLAAYTFDLPIRIRPNNADGTIPASDAAKWERCRINLAAVDTALTPRVQTFTRKMTTAAGFESATALCRFVKGLQASWTDLLDGGTAVLQFVNLSGTWT